jgi:DNA helicase-2/ATP-dependent DNA helicase PcrA
LSEVPENLIVNMGPKDESGEINLHGERYDVRQSARRNTYTGKTYNSLDNISQFFGDRGMPFNRPAAQSPRPNAPSGIPPSAASQLPRPHGPTRPLPAAPPAPRKTARTGMTVNHPKYGTGTVVRREGEGDDAKITVNFPRFGLKKLIEKYAGLKRD